MLHRIALALALMALASSPLAAQIQTAGTLFVDLAADDGTGGDFVWDNNGTLADFDEVGDPVLLTIDGVDAVVFNGIDDAYTCQELAPAGLTGLDPTRSIEVWVWNDTIDGEETLVSWGKRGGPPAGTNMSFNYGTNASFGAVGHWGDPDLGWNNGGGAPTAMRWHHLAYTYDGTTTRVYADGVLQNSEELGAGVINTHPDSAIAVASQWEADGVTLTGILKGSLAIARVRVHDDVLTPAQILNNFTVEASDLGIVNAPTISAPTSDSVAFDAGTYSAEFRAEGFPTPTVTATAPAGATVNDEGGGRYTVEYTLPGAPPDSFDVTVEATNAGGTEQATWTVDVISLVPGQIEIAGDLIVDIDAADASAGTALWINNGDGGNFVEAGDPVKESIAGAPAVTFDGTNDYYAADDLTPLEIVGADATRSIEVWVFNPVAADEETMVSWGKRGGGAGTNMSFNYGVNGSHGAVGHWGAGPDLGWFAFGGSPSPSTWHHLAYTYDGTTTRVYSDGALLNSEVLGPGVINTHPDGAIALATQWDADGVTATAGLRGSLSIGRVRVHSEALSDLQIAHNYATEESDFDGNEPAMFVDPPTADTLVKGSTAYNQFIVASGIPAPTVTLLEPAGAELLDTDGGALLRYGIPSPEPASFQVRVSADNGNGAVEASWTVTLVDPPASPPGIAVAGELFVNLDARDDSAGEAVWVNQGTAGDFVEVGDPALIDIDGVEAVSFNTSEILDAYQIDGATPGGLIGPDPTRSIEAWVYNVDEVAEETILAWGKRGGGPGTNMSFNYGSDANFGAVGHWGADGPDLGWFPGGGAPFTLQWHHLAYTYDGTTTRVYVDGLETNSEELGAGVINTFAAPKITLASQINADGTTLDFGRRGALALARVRIHDEVLSPAEITQNFEAERNDFPLPEPPEPEPIPFGPVHRYSFDGDADDSVGDAHGVPVGDVTFAGSEAVLNNDGSQLSADGLGAYIDLPNGIISALESATFETWMTWNGPQDSSWQRVFDFGTSSGGEDIADTGDNQLYTFLTPRSSANTTRFGYDDGATERQVNAPATLAGEPSQHIVVTWDYDSGNFITTVSLYVNGQLRSVDGGGHFLLNQLIDVNNWLGRSQFGPDAMLAGSYDEFRIYDYALTANQVLGNFGAGPSVVNTGGQPTGFRRGDADAVGAINLTDGVFLLNFLFLGGPPPPCDDAADANDDGVLNITTGVFVFNWLFLGGPQPTAPGPTACGPDPSADELDCASYDNCDA